MVCSSPDGALPICEPGFGDCDLAELDCETSFDDGQPSCLPVYLGSLELDPGISVSAIGLSANSEIYFAGSFAGVVDFDPGPGSEIASGTSSAFVTKLGADGSYRWTRTFNGTADSLVWAENIAVDPDGSVLFVGTFDGSIDLDPSAASDLHDSGTAAFVVALSEAGEYRYGTSFGSAESLSWGAGAATNDSGESYVLMTSEIKLDSGERNKTGLLLTKLDAAGQPLWSRASRGSECSVSPMAVVATSEGVVATGNVEGRCELDGFTSEVSSRDPARAAGLLARFDRNGAATEWGFVEGQDSRSLATVYGVRPAASGELLVAGQLEGRSDLDPGPAVVSRGVAEDDVSSFIVRLDEPGAFVWGQAVPSFAFGEMAVADDGNIFLHGYLVNGYRFEVLAFSPVGRSRFALSFDSNVIVATIAASAQQLVVLGRASGTPDLDPTSGVDLATTDSLFLARFALSSSYYSP